MKIINPHVELESDYLISPELLLKHIEKVGRVCYKSEDKITHDSYKDFIKMIIDRGHESVLEHASLTFKITCDRGVSHELVRHRIASYSQESTRYCNYSLGKFDGDLTFVKPFFYDEASEPYRIWYRSMAEAEVAYMALLSMECKPQDARDLLPNSLKTELYVTMDMRSWRHFLKLRTSKNAHPQMREIALMIYDIFQSQFPILVSDIERIPLF